MVPSTVDFYFWKYICILFANRSDMIRPNKVCINLTSVLKISGWIDQRKIDVFIKAIEYIKDFR